MEKSKIIEYVITEWAMRSPDGLVSGYSNAENINALIKLLNESTLPEEDINEMVEALYGEAARKPKSEDYAYLFAVKDNKGKVSHLVSYGHPEPEQYPDGEIYNGPHELELNQYKTYNKENAAKALAAAEKDPLFKSLKADKGISIYNVNVVKDILSTVEKENPESVSLFKAYYDKITSINEAIEIYEGRKYSAMQAPINAIDAVKFSGVGRGEIPFVFLLKGAKSGGTTKVDILFAEGNIEVKELIGNKIKISTPTLKNYSNSKFNVAIHELALAVNKIKGIKEFCIKVLEDKGELYMAVNDPKLEEHKNAINVFFDNPRVTELTITLLDAIFIISTKILNKKQADKTPKATIDIDIQDKHREFKVPENAIEDLQAQLSKISQTSLPVKLSIPVSSTAEEGDDAIEQKVMKLSFFKENWDLDRVQKEIVEELIAKNYSKLLVIEKSSTSNTATLYGPDTISRLKFSGVSLAKIELKMP